VCVCLQCVSLGDDVLRLASKSVHLEKCIVFRLDIPGRRVLAVRARVNHTLSDVVSPILSRASISYADVVIHIVRCTVSSKGLKGVTARTYLRTAECHLS